VTGWLLVMHTYLYYFPLSLSLSPRLCGETPLHVAEAHIEGIEALTGCTYYKF